MRQLFPATIYRMYKSTGVRVAVALTWVSATLYYIFAKMIADGQLDATTAGSVTALGDGMIIWLFGSLLLGILVGTDFENKTIHGAINFGRIRIIMNYMATFAVLMLLLVLPYTIGSVICLIANVDMAGAEGTMISIYMGNVFGFTKETSLGKLALSYLAYAIVYIGQLSICIPVAVKLPKPMVVTAFGFIFGMLTALLQTIASNVKILDNIYKLTPYHYGMAKLGLDAGVDEIWIGILVSIIFTGIMGFGSWLLFSKADIK